MRRFVIEGMTCGGCANGLTQALKRAGFDATVTLEDHTATIAGEPDEQAVREAVVRAGFSVVEAELTPR